VVGFFRARIVLPEWVLGLEERQRALVIAHEEEHVRAGDTRLLALALLSAVLMPWNLALWWQIRRLRHAVELDCDARVLKRRPDVRGYTSLLIELGRRRTPRALAVAAFSESSSLLERRIETIVTPKSRRWRLPAAVATLVTAALVVAALEVPRPALAQARPRPDARPPAAAAVRPSDPPQPVAEARTERSTQATHALPDAALRSREIAPDTLRSRFQPEELAALAEKEFPAALRARGIEGNATLRFAVDRQGKAQRVEVLAETRPEFAEAATRVVEQLHFWPARVGEQPIEESASPFKVSFRLHQAAQTERAAPNAVERLLRIAIAQYYPELLRGGTRGTPYVYLVVDPRGNVIHRALDRSRPSTPVIRDAILNHFPELPRTRSAVRGGSGYSVRTGIAGGEDIEVSWVTLAEPAAPVGPIRWGPYPLDAVSASNGFPAELVKSALQERYAREIRQGLPEGSTIWFAATMEGAVLDSGIAPPAEFHERLRERTDSSAFSLVMFLDGPDGSKVRTLGIVRAPKPGEAGVISGRVTDEAGDAIAGATVLFQDRLRGTVSGENGEYRLSNVPPGSYTLIVRRPGGGAEATREVSIGAGGGANADFVVPK
jgi:TonB family protein